MHGKGLENPKLPLMVVVSSKTDELPLPGVTILIEELGTGVAADENGFYTLSLKKGSLHTGTKSSQSYTEKKIKIDLRSDGSQDFLLGKQNHVT